MEMLDWRALRAGGAVALVVAVPCSLAATWLNDNDERHPAVPWLVLGALAGFVLGAGISAWTQNRQLPLAHGMVCAIGTYVGAQAVFIAVRLARGHDVNWFAFVFNVTAVAFAGLIGGGLGVVLTRRGARPSARAYSQDR